MGSVNTYDSANNRLIPVINEMVGAQGSICGVAGLVPTPQPGDEDKVLKGDGTWGRVDGISDMTGATSSLNGVHGLVPAPHAGDQTKFFRGDGTWTGVTPQLIGALPSNDIGTGAIKFCEGRGNYTCCLIATINILKNNADCPIAFEISGRNGYLTTLQILFNPSVIDPDLNYFYTNNNTAFYLYKETTSTWKLYGQYVSTTPSWGSYLLHRVVGSCIDEGRINVTVNMENVSSIPSGAVQATPYYVDAVSQQTINGAKTFKNAVMIDLSEGAQTADTAYRVLSFKYKNPDSQIKDVKVIRTYGDSETGSAYNGIAIIGSSSGATIISSGESTPAVIASQGMSNSEAINMVSDTAITFFTNANTPENVVYCGGFEESGILRIQKGIAFTTEAKLETSKNLFASQHVTSPTHFLGLVSDWSNCGYVSMSEARAALKTDYQVGDVYQVSSGAASFPGVLTGGSKDIIFSVHLPKPLTSDITTVTIDTLSGSYRGTNGYAGGAQNVNILNIAGTTTSVQGMDRNSGVVTIKTHYDTALTTPTNNSPIIFTGSIKLTFTGSS